MVDLYKEVRNVSSRQKAHNSNHMIYIYIYMVVLAYLAVS